MEPFQQLTRRFRRALGRWTPHTPSLSRPSGPVVAAVAIGGLTAECHCCWPAEGEARRLWEDLLGRCPAATPFACPLWQEEGMGPTVAGGALRLVVVRREGQLVAMVPLALSAGGFVESIGYAVSDYLDPLVDPAVGGDAWRIILALLARTWDRQVRAVTLHNIPAESACRALLPALAKEAAFVYEERSVASIGRVELPSSWEAYLDRLEAHERKEVRRKLRKAEQEGAARLVVQEGADVDDALIARSMDLIEAASEDKRQWLAEHVRPLLTRIGPKLAAQGRLRVLTLLVHDAPASVLIDLPSSRGPLLYNSGFDPAARQWSPGVVTFALAIQEAISRRCRVFDLLRGDEPYKQRMGAKLEPLYRVTLHR